ncbi:CLUMA_CG008288, isoform A [Clunio marinus]|uniref:CLUMA_CG008288, isoform A n=1 Tax=Clunio marinus TaxID=568069 RepID=A0A1J1I4V7_9DIPT|nr:CLUMA_CG008288, isoform A [Clunio marinus]
MKVKTKKIEKLEKMSVDDFFENIDVIENTSGASDIDESIKKKVSKKNKKTKEIKSENVKLKKKKDKLVKKKIQKQEVQDNPSSESEQEEEVDEKSHKKALGKLKKTDPELFKFLQENDKKLLNFGEEVEAAENGNEASEDEENQVHKAVDALEVASDESDYEDEDAPMRKDNAVTLKLLKEWQESLQSDEVPIDVIRNVIKAFNSALISISGDPNMRGEFIVEGAAIFNGIIQLCVLYLEKAIRQYLKLSGKANFREIQKCKRFSKVKNVLRSYLLDMTKLLETVSSSNILSVILKHLHQIASVLAAFTSITKPVLKRLIQIWSTGEESIRIVAFLCILKITRNQQELFLNQVLKTMYMEYVRNSKFVSPNTLPAINFMRRSLTELFLLDLNIAYHHVFLFIRQLAIHLRNAILLQKKEHFQQIYNWQYVNSLKLWGDVLSTVSINSSGNKADQNSKLQALIYPLVSIINGVIKLKSSANYFPLRFHCVKILIDISRATKVFIPILPYILEVLNSNTFNQQHKKLAMKPISFTCILRIQKGHLDENSFRDEVVEQVYGMTLECLINECTSIAFPDLVVPHVMALNHFIKNTKNPNYAKKLKQLTEKIVEQSNYVDSRRNKINFSLNDANFIKSWEINLRTGQTPLEVFYNQWQQTNVKKLKRQKIDKDEDSDEDEEHDYDNLPKVKAPKTKKIRADGQVELFPSDDEDDGAIDFDVDTDNSFENDESEGEVVEKQSNKKNGKFIKNGKGNQKEESDASSEDNDDNETFLDNGDIVEELTDW